jgi:hypothetical protein
MLETETSSLAAAGAAISGERDSTNRVAALGPAIFDVDGVGGVRPCVCMCRVAEGECGRSCMRTEEGP